MTPSTEATLRELAAVVCPECQHCPGEPDYPDGPGATTHGEFIRWKEECPRCQDCICHGTGRRFWRLTEACTWGHNQLDQCKEHVVQHCTWCHGTNRVLASADLLERVLDCLFQFDVAWVFVSENGAALVLNSRQLLGVEDHGELSDISLLDSATAALAAAVQRETAGAGA